MRFVKNFTCWILSVAVLLILSAGFATVSRADDGDVDIPIGDLVGPTDPSVPSEPGVISSGSYGALTWVLHTDGLLQVTGTGAMPEEQAPWYGYRGSVKAVQIGEGVTTVSGQAFQSCNHMESVELPQGIKAIGYGAFVGCRSLEEISIPSTVTSIGEVAFGACSSLKSIVLPEGITVIEQSTFKQCTQLTSVTIGWRVKSIHENAFAGCSALDAVYYHGDEAQWEQISVEDGNDALLEATRYYNPPEVLRGDVNGDHQVDDADALYLLRNTLFSDRFPINQSGDMNGDGSEDDADALYLLRYTLFPDRFPL